MFSKKQPETCTENLHGNKTEQKPGLSRHYRQIGIKSVAAATRKENGAPQQIRDPMAVKRKRNNTEGGHND